MTQENIHIAILGPVSAGKSTFLNSLFSNTFSDMKRKKTTMLPQIYKTTNNSDIIDSQEHIYTINHEMNEKILKLREENKYTQADFKELIYNVERIDDFIKLPDKHATYSILDMPGLNCGGGDNMYFNYISQISKNIDIYILVFDINSGLNTTDEINILTVIANEIKKNKHGYVHILINKCDDVIYEKNSFEFADDELQELYDRSVDTINKHLKDINVNISPLCASDLYVFRCIKNNIDSIDEKHLDKIIMNECGKKELGKLKTIVNKQKFIQGLITLKKSTLYDDWMKDTGYNMFKLGLNNIISNYTKIIEYHIEMELTNILSNNITDFDIITNNIIIINNRLDVLKNIDKSYIKSDSIDKLINDINTKITTFIDSGINSYSASTVDIADSFIDKLNKFVNKIKMWATSNSPFEQSKTKLIDKRFSLLNDTLMIKYNEKIFAELYNNSKINPITFGTCIANTLIVSVDEPSMPDIVIKLLKSVSSITNITNNNEYIEIILHNYTTGYNKIQYKYPDTEESYKLGTNNQLYYKSIEELFIVVSQLTNKNIQYMINLLNGYFMCDLNSLNYSGINNIYHNSNIKTYKNWLDCHKHLFVIPEINYIYYCITSSIENGLICQTNKLTNFYFAPEFRGFEAFNNINKRMDNVFKILTDIYTDKGSIILNEPYFSADELPPPPFEKTNEDTDVSSEEYSDNDDPKTVLTKAHRNVSIRTKRNIKLGSK